MKMVYSVFSLVVFFVFTGCRDKENAAASGALRELSDDFDRHLAMMTNSNTEGHAFADHVMQKLLSLPDSDERKRLFDLWRKTALKFNYRALPVIDNDPRRGRSYTMMSDLFAYVFPRAASSEEEKWRIKLEYLNWWRTFVIDVSVKRPYPKGVFATKENRLAKKHGYRNALIEYRRWLDEYNYNSCVYERRLVELESRFQYDKANMTPDTAKRIEDFLEKSLGRKMRTKEQCDADFYAKRRIEFPEYVPTPEGLVDEWVERFW